MDQLGFGLEQFDAVGRFRTLDGTSPIDSSGEMPGGRRFEGPESLSQVLAVSEEQAFLQTAASRMLSFAIGRELSATDRCSVDQIVTRSKAAGGGLQDLILETVCSKPFQFVDVDPDEELDDETTN
jgi:hypothetical protein